MRLYSASSKIVSIDSFFASPMKPQVLTTMTSASSGCSTTRHPVATGDAEHHLGVDAVLDAAQADEVDLALGHRRTGLPSTRRGSSPAHEAHEPVEHVESVVRTGGRLGVVLDAEGAQPLDRQALGGPVVEVHVRRLGI